MKNKDFENIDILKELELSLDNTDTSAISEEIEIDTTKIIEIAESESNKNKNSDFLIQEEPLFILDNVKESNDVFATLDILEEKTPIVKKKRNTFISSIIFLTKYILTSSLIFAILLITTNYSAYINVAKSYIFKGEMEITSQKLISSVEASNIKDKYSQVKLVEIEKNEIEAEKLSIKQMKKEQDKQNLDLNIEITPYENRIIIPKIGKNIPLIDVKNRSIAGEEELNDIFMNELENGVVRYPGSAKPGEDGTSFIFGHSSNFPWMKGEYNSIFALLDNVEFNDEIIVYYGQEKYIYKIREKKVITPGDVSVLERNKKKSEITLMTCRPIGTTLNRLIVTGELVKANNY